MSQVEFGLGGRREPDRHEAVNPGFSRSLVQSGQLLTDRPKPSPHVIRFSGTERRARSLERTGSNPTPMGL